MRRRQPPPYDLIAFDCDSTLSTIEGIDELGRGVPGIAELTDRAMAGEVPLEEVYGLRLERIEPGRDALEEVGRRYVETAVAGARELVSALRSLGKRVVIVSGGLRAAILPLAAFLGIDDDDVFAVDVEFGPDGTYAGFDASQPLACAGGKVEVVRALAKDQRAALVGDGATDLEARGEVERFVAFAGVAEREAVVRAADEVVRVPDLLALAPHLISDDERSELAVLGAAGFAEIDR